MSITNNADNMNIKKIDHSIFIDYAIKYENLYQINNNLIKKIDLNPNGDMVRCFVKLLIEHDKYDLKAVQDLWKFVPEEQQFEIFILPLLPHIDKYLRLLDQSQERYPQLWVDRNLTKWITVIDLLTDRINAMLALTWTAKKGLISIDQLNAGLRK